MTLSLVAVGVLVFAARVVDVTLGTLRTVAIVHGHRGSAWFLGFFEILIWLVAVSGVVRNLDEPWLAICFALGFATGNFVGISIDQHLALGQQVVRIFTQKGAEVAAALREFGARVTEMDGRGPEGPLQLLFIGTPRRIALRLVDTARRIDPCCYYVIDDVRLNSAELAPIYEPTGWRAILKKK